MRDQTKDSVGSVCLYGTAIVQTSFCSPEIFISECLVVSYSHGLNLLSALVPEDAEMLNFIRYVKLLAYR